MITQYQLDQKRENTREAIVYKLLKVFRFLLVQMWSFLKSILVAIMEAIKMFIRF